MPRSHYKNVPRGMLAGKNRAGYEVRRASALAVTMIFRSSVVFFRTPKQRAGFTLISKKNRILISLCTWSEKSRNMVGRYPVGNTAVTLSVPYNQHSVTGYFKILKTTPTYSVSNVQIAFNSCDLLRSSLFGITCYGSFRYLTLACKHL